jgi:hypothetical protein
MALPEPSQTTRNVMVILIVIGALLAATGLGLAIFTKIVTHQGITGVLLITGLIVGGLALSVPAKLYLTLQLMRHADEKAAVRRTEP